MLFLFLLILLVLIPIYFRLSAYTEGGLLMLRAELELPFKISVKLYSAQINAKSAVKALLSRKRKKGVKAQIFPYALKSMHITRLSIKALIGTGDAFSTALVAGEIAGIISPIAAGVSGENCLVDIKPAFNEQVLEADITCLLYVNGINAFKALMEILRRNFKWKSILLKT